MIGTLIGDVVGNLQVNNQGNIRQEEVLAQGGFKFSANTVIPTAIALAIMNNPHDSSNQQLLNKMAQSLITVIKGHKDFSYPLNIEKWVYDDDHTIESIDEHDYLLQALPVPFFYDSIEKAREVASLAVQINNNNENVIQGAQAISSFIFLANKKTSKEEIQEYIHSQFLYDLNISMDTLQLTYSPSTLCNHSLPECMICALQANNFIQAMQNITKIKGDALMFTITASLAKALYGYPLDLGIACKMSLKGDLVSVVDQFLYLTKQADPFFIVNNKIDQAIITYTKEKTNEKLNSVFNCIYTSMRQGGHLLVPSEMIQQNNNGKVMRGQRMMSIKDQNGKLWYAGFTNPNHAGKGPKSILLSVDIRTHLKNIRTTKEYEGIIINPFSEGCRIRLTNQVIDHILDDSKFVRNTVDPNKLN